MAKDDFRVSESVHTVKDEEGEKQFRTTRVHVGQPRDKQERAGLILARAQQWLNRIRDQYMLLRSAEKAQAAAEGRELLRGDVLEHSLDIMIKLIDLAHHWMSSPSSVWEDLNGKLVIQRFNVDGTLTFDGDTSGIFLGDYVEVLRRLYKICENECAFAAGIQDPAPSEQYFHAEISQLPANLDHHQLEYERQDYHMDIGVRRRHDATVPDFDLDDPIHEKGGAPVDPEPLKPHSTEAKEKRRRAKKKATKKKRGHKGRRRGK